MEIYFSDRIQNIAIIVSFGFLFYIGRLILKGKLREEYAIFWIVSTILLVIFSIWRHGLTLIAHLVGVYLAPNLVFTSAIFAILVYLLHLSIVVSKLQHSNKSLGQNLALMQKRLDELETKTKSDDRL